MVALINNSPKSLMLQRDGKRSNPQEHSCLCDWGERAQPTKLQLQGRRGNIQIFRMMHTKQSAIASITELF